MSDTESKPLNRYARQIRYAPIGEQGQRRLLASKALICGCGALGSVIANTLARAGVGTLRIVDRDFLELNNLQRQVLFDEADVAAALPKAVAAAYKLRRINSNIEIEPIVADVDPGNIWLSVTAAISFSTGPTISKRVSCSMKRRRNCNFLGFTADALVPKGKP